VIEKEPEQEVKEETKETPDPWRSFKEVCKDYGVDYRDVIAKCAWRYLEETGGVEDSPISRVKEAAGTLKEFEEVVSSATASDSLRKVKDASEAVEHVAKLKDNLSKLKSEELTIADLIALGKKTGLIK